MSRDDHDDEEDAIRQEQSGGWTKPPPLALLPTYWPAVTALSIVVLVFGFLTSWMISLTGFIVFVIAMSHWVGEMNRHDGS